MLFWCSNITGILESACLCVWCCCRCCSFLLMDFVLFLAAEITGIRFEDNITDTRNGVILLQYENTWVTICHHGEPNTWGKREAIVACTELGFAGGWPTEIKKSDLGGVGVHLNNFFCDGSK